jgi:hypothetical protein
MQIQPMVARKTNLVASPPRFGEAAKRVTLNETSPADFNPNSPIT